MKMPLLLQQIEEIEHIYDRLFQLGRIQIERTKTNKELEKIEALYLPKFTRIFKQIVKEYGSNLHFL